MTHRNVDRHIVELARRQHGVFSRAQVQIAGGTDRLIDARLDAGSWRRLATGVYAYAANPATWKQKVMASVVGEPTALASRTAAAAVHGLHGYRPGRPVITVPVGSNHRSELARVHQSDLVAGTRVDGIPVTTVAQTIIDLAGRTRYERLLAAAESAVLQRSMTIDDLGRRYLALSRSRLAGCGKVRAIIEMLGADGYVPLESELEVHLSALLRDPRVPRHERQATFAWSPRRHDAFIAQWQLIVEADGRRWHARMEAFAEDRRRDNAAAAHGIQVVRFSWEDLTSLFDDSLGALLEIGASRASLLHPHRSFRH